MASWQKHLALAAFSDLVVAGEGLRSLKTRKGPPFLGRRPFGVAATSNSRPSGAQGRKTVKISIAAYRLPLHGQTADRHQRRLALKFFARLGFFALLYWFRGRIHCSSSSAELSYRSSGPGSAILRPKGGASFHQKISHLRGSLIVSIQYFHIRC